MAEMKTKVNDTSVTAFLNRIPDAQVREDCWTVVEIMQSATKAEPRMWGSAIVGFGEYTMVYPNGREMPWMVTGFSPRKQNITLYTGSSFPEHDALLAQLGKHSCGKGCLYIKKLSDVDVSTLKKLVGASVRHKLKPNSATTNSKLTSRSKSSSSGKSKARSPKSGLPKSGSKTKTRAGLKSKSKPGARRKS